MKKTYALTALSLALAAVPAWGQNVKITLSGCGHLRSAEVCVPA